ncbi:Non-canonical purine NTP pyrophosphatase [Nitrospira japonica]|uniref:dITP/XTP pyrophosphatase n=1 Tax=Nitrospira japonica TaxID=1325564 RepID=A0A1W1I8H4_9BACT|nr:XTP/dITP diphosphatase [Nitrospira japonica]SLM49306.1 Non-canonical purine NTP pyrophosphatase [Nitrospira japonica]
MAGVITELVLATRNLHKGEELTALLSSLGIRVRTLAEFPDAPEVIEDGDTCEANAVKKARTIADVTGLPAVADDTGLEVDALDGRPGVFAARYAGEHVTYEDNWRKLLKELAGVSREGRQARFLTVAALALPGGVVEVAQGTLEGIIAEEPAGTGGFGYDPVFHVPELGKTLAELSAEQKNCISHRAKAFAEIREILLSKSESSGTVRSA